MATTTSEEQMVAYLSDRPVATHLKDWLNVARQLIASGSHLRGKLLLEAILQARDDCTEAHVLLVHAHLQLGSGHWLQALEAARCAVATCCGTEGVAPQHQAECKLALGLALGSAARLPLISQGERSRLRSEARVVLQAAAQQPGGHVVSSLYALAMVDAEGGHYEQAVQHAQQALEAAEAAGGDALGAEAPTVALLALLLSARQQLQAAVMVVEAGLTNLNPSERCHNATAAAIAGGGLPRCHDILLQRVRAQLLLAAEDAGGALDVLGSARRSLSASAKLLEGKHGAAAAAAVLRQQEAQVWRDLALAYASQQQIEDAQLCVQHMQQLDPHGAATYHAVGCVATASGDAVAAKQAFKAALALDATYAPALLSLGALLRRQGDAHDLSVAASLLTDALRYEPHSHMGWFNLGLARQAQGHLAEGEKHLFTAVTLAAAAPVLGYGELPLCI